MTPVFDSLADLHDNEAVGALVADLALKDWYIEVCEAFDRRY